MITLTKKLLNSGPIDLSRFHVLVFYYLKLSLSSLFSFFQTAVYGKSIKKTVVDESPVFILGHFRSGTTYLHKLLATDERFGYITNYDILCPNSSLLLGKRFGILLQKLINLLRIKNYHFNNSIHQLFDPGEEDMFMISRGDSASAYWGFLFPRHFEYLLQPHKENEKSVSEWRKTYMQTLQYASYRNQGKRLILKNPPCTGKIRELLQLFPKAKFIYIYRNPYHLFFSMKNLWTKVIFKYYTLQNVTTEGIDNIIYEYYSKLITQYESEKGLIPYDNLIEVSFEHLENDPFTIIREIYAKIRLADFREVSEKLKQRIEEESKYRKFEYKYSREVLDRTSDEWKDFIQNRGYSMPTNNGIIV